MTRIIAGAFGGRQISTPKGDGTRPTSDRVREALFSSLESELGGFDEEMRVLDLFAGSGALGFEAVSRGAGFVEFVEADRKAAAVIRANAASLGVRSLVRNSTVESWLQSVRIDHFELVFLDPPYAMPTAEVASIVARLASAVDLNALFVVERSSRDPFIWPDGVEPLRDKRYGETTLWYGRALLESSP